jgi:hypothetical protein
MQRASCRQDARFGHKVSAISAHFAKKCSDGFLSNPLTCLDRTPDSAQVGLGPGDRSSGRDRPSLNEAEVPQEALPKFKCFRVDSDCRPVEALDVRAQGQGRRDDQRPVRLPCNGTARRGAGYSSHGHANSRLLHGSPGHWRPCAAFDSRPSSSPCHHVIELALSGPPMIVPWFPCSSTPIGDVLFDGVE